MYAGRVLLICALVTLCASCLVPKETVTGVDIGYMTSRITRANSCAICDEKAEYLTPFGMLCPAHSNQMVNGDTSWIPIPLHSGSHVTMGLRRRIKP